MPDSWLKTGSVLVLGLFLTRTAFAQARPEFKRDIAPILYQTCAPCHHDGGTGPFPLTTYEEIRKHAHQIADVTARRYMPPWLPDEGHGDFAEKLRLSDAQIHMIAAWISQGAKADNNPVAAPSFSEGWTLGKPDLVVTATQPFEVPAAGTDVFWNFVFTPQLTKYRYVRAFEIRPMHANLIHHANIIIDRLGTTRMPFAGMEVSVPRNPLDLDGHFLFFKPGAVSLPEADGFSWRIDPGTTLILNTHMQPSGKAEKEQPSIALYFTDRKPAFATYLLQLDNDNALNIPAGTQDFLVTDDFTLPIDTLVIAIYPHAHYLGKVLEAFATLPDKRRVWLIRISDWDPNWQSVYRYEKPIDLPAGTIISMRYRYDNSAANPRNPNRPLRRVEAGNRATDEMAHLWLEIIPKSTHDSRRIYAEAWARHKLAKNPLDYEANITLGSLALARFDAAAAVKPLQIAVKSRADDAIARNLYGAALAATGRNELASKEFEEALELKPDLLNARFNLAHAEAKAGKTGEAIQNLKEILKISPNDEDAKGFLDQLTAH